MRFFAVVLGAAVAFVALFTCWVMNIIKLASIPSIEGHVGEVIIRAVGVFLAPVGIIAGLF